MKIDELINLFQQATGFTVKRINGGYKCEVITDLVTAEISLAEIKRQCRSYCNRRIDEMSAEAAFCEDYDSALWYSQCAENWRKTLSRI